MSSRTVYECDRCGKETTLYTHNLKLCTSPMAEWIDISLGLCYDCELELDPIQLKHKNEINDWMMEGKRYGKKE